MILLDRSIPKSIVDGLKAVRRDDVKWLTDVPGFSQDTPDEHWIAFVGRSGWMAVTRDERIRYTAAEKHAVQSSGAGLFVIGNQGNSSKWVTFRTIVCHLDDMLDAWAGTAKPFIYVVTVRGMRRIL